MSYYYQDLIKAIALRTGQIIDGSATTRKNAYASASIEGSLDGTDLPWGAFKNDILAVEKELAGMVGSSNNPQFRRQLAAQSGLIESGGLVPLNDESGFRFIGTFDGILDADNDTPLTEQPVNVVMRRIVNGGSKLSPGTFWKCQHYNFCYQGSIILHTRPNAVYFRGCSWDFATQSVLYDTAASTPAAKVFAPADVTVANNTVTEIAHGYFTGLRVRVSTATTLPTPLVINTDYWLIVIDADTYKFASSLANALIAVPIDLTNQGTGNHTTTPQGSAGGGQSPLPQDLQVLHACKVLAQLPQEDWFVPEAGYYRTLAAEKGMEIVEGKIALMEMPAMPDTAARINPERN